MLDAEILDQSISGVSSDLQQPGGFLTFFNLNIPMFKTPSVDPGIYRAALTPRLPHNNRQEQHLLFGLNVSPDARFCVDNVGKQIQAVACLDCHLPFLVANIIFALVSCYSVVALRLPFFL